MVDPSDVTQFARTNSELEEFVLFSIAVAGKTAIIVSRQLHNLLDSIPGRTPFKKIRNLIKKGQLRKALQKARLGKYNVLCKAFKEVINLDLKNCTVEELEAIHGIGPKTARFFLLHSRKNVNVAALDTHILQWMRKLGYKTPKSTPTGKKYRELEKAFIKEAKKRKISIAKLDLDIWNANSVSTKIYLKELAK